MATCTIKAGHHYHSLPPLTTLPWAGESSIGRIVEFDESCVYDSDAYHADDVNKLFGLSFGFGGIHHNSARFGWRYSKTNQAIELLAYCYINGQRNWNTQMQFPVIGKVQPGDKVICTINYNKETGESLFWAVCEREVRDRVLYIYADNKPTIGACSVKMAPNLPNFGLTHGPYFGGDLTASHDMIIHLDRP